MKIAALIVWLIATATSFVVLSLVASFVTLEPRLVTDTPIGQAMFAGMSIYWLGVLTAKIFGDPQ